MSIFLTGSTGYLGSYLAHLLLKDHTDRLALLVRATSVEEGYKRLWKAFQLHMDFSVFSHALENRIDVYLGDLTLPKLGLKPDDRSRLVKDMDSVIHCAASLNRRSEKACLNINLRGTLEVIKLARDAFSDHGLRRFSEVSTVAVAGNHQDDLVSEDQMIDWSNRDYDPYARTKKFCEHMIKELLPDVPHTIFRPSIILGDSRFPQTTQFDMVRAFVWLTQIPVLPFSKRWLLDIVPADYVSQAIVTIHQKEAPKYSSYNLSSGKDSLSYRQLTRALRKKGCGSRHVFLPWLRGLAATAIKILAHTPRSWGFSKAFSLMHVFMPYLTYNTVFNNQHVVEELGKAPTPFDRYAPGLFHFARKGNFSYPYSAWPSGASIKKKVA